MNIESPSYELLNAFVVFLDSPNMIAAARKLGISQPALTQKLKILEREVAVTLFEFVGKKKVATSEALDLKRRLERHFEALKHEVLEWGQQCATEKKLILRIAGRPEIIARFLPILDFEGEIIATGMDTRLARHSLEVRACDMAIMQDPPDSHAFIAKKMFEEKMNLVIPSQWLQSNELTRAHVETLVNRPLALYKNDLTDVQKLLGHFKISATPKPARVFDDWRCLGELFQAGRYWGLLPSAFAQATAKMRVLDLPSSLFGTSTFYCVYPRRLGANPAIRKIATQLQSKK